MTNLSNLRVMNIYQIVGVSKLGHYQPQSILAKRKKYLTENNPKTHRLKSCPAYGICGNCATACLRTPPPSNE